MTHRENDIDSMLKNAVDQDVRVNAAFMERLHKIPEQFEQDLKPAASPSFWQFFAEVIAAIPLTKAHKRLVGAVHYGLYAIVLSAGIVTGTATGVGDVLLDNETQAEEEYDISTGYWENENSDYLGDMIIADQSEELDDTDE